LQRSLEKTPRVCDVAGDLWLLDVLYYDF
jgi:hypothetical protein